MRPIFVRHRVGIIVSLVYLIAVGAALIFGVTNDVAAAQKGYPGGADFSGVPALLLSSPSSIAVAVPLLAGLQWTPSADGWVARTSYPNSTYLLPVVIVGAVLNLAFAWIVAIMIRWIARKPVRRG